MSILINTLPVLEARASSEIENIVTTRELVELIFVQPYSRISNVVGAGIAKRQTASEYLKELVDIGVLEEKKVGREKLFIHPKLMTVLTSDEHVIPRYGS